MVVCKDDCGVTAPTEKACAHFCEGAKKRCNQPWVKSKCPKTCDVFLDDEVYQLGRRRNEVFGS